MSLSELTEHSDALARRRLHAAMIALIVAEIIATLESNMMFAALPTVAREYGSLSDAAWLLTGYSLIAACSAILGSRLGDMYGRKLALLVVLLVSAAGSVLSAVANDELWTIVGRGFQGTSGAILPLAFGIVRATATPARAKFWVGMLVGAWTGSAALGYVVGGAFADSGAWKQMFWVTALGGAFAAVLGLWLLPKDTAAVKSGGRIDWVGATLLVPAILLAMFGVSNSASAGWGSATALPIVAGFLLAILWVRHELRQSDPLVDVRLLAHLPVAMGNLCYALLALGGMQLGVIIMLLFQQPTWTGIGVGVSATVAGVLKLPSNVISSLAGPVSGILGGRYGDAVPLTVGAATLATGWMMIFLINDAAWQVVAGSIVTVIGTAMIMTAIPNLILSAVPLERSSEMTGLSLVVRGLFIAVGTQVVTALLDSSSISRGSVTHPSAEAYALAIGFIVVTTLLILLVGLVLIKINRRSPREAPLT